MIKLTAVVLSIGILAGCAQDVPLSPKETLHPSWPESIVEYNQKWQVKVIDGNPWVGMPFEDSQEFRIWLNDVKRYVHDQKTMLCYYRSGLKEEKCQ
ncbi:hypothetical protein PhAPEC2_214 [Escherichia phage vB_EcoM_PhAPEC2]|uniref:Outer membrane lipoprotein Rz1 n=1 Tax=Escherichia phage vB_EcoM_PhAPEC2 TaxID=1391224 RepID=A0A067ZHI0_9CAUD|nr:Rz-like spanin [Escherichia phage vB_EcoM_PhAPEC2]AHV82923.1 hypothetical protein PhAPEC2_214 [Escherichia phage vB_EcoM_PhAPEC2]